MILEIDIGNSSIKWRIRDGVVFNGITSFEHSSLTDFDRIFDAVVDLPKQVVVATVVPKLKSALSEWCMASWQVQPYFVEVSQYCAGVTSAYQQVEQMGVDRWLALLAAYHQNQSACLVIDSGSALTVDLLLSSGQHMGGYIVPGLMLMKNALFRDTAQVKPTTIIYDGLLAPGNSTQRAVSSGFQLMHLGLICAALERLSVVEERRPDLVLTGGGAKALAEVLQSFMADRSQKIGEIIISPSLVMDGLSLAYPTE